MNATSPAHPPSQAQPRRHVESWCRPADHSCPHHSEPPQSCRNQPRDATTSLIHGFRLSVTTVDDKRFEIQLTLDDVLNVHADLVELLAAGQDKVNRWWQTLADGSDGRPRAPKRFARAAAHESGRLDPALVEGTVHGPKPCRHNKSKDPEQPGYRTTRKADRAVNRTIKQTKTATSILLPPLTRGAGGPRFIRDEEPSSALLAVASPNASPSIAARQPRSAQSCCATAPAATRRVELVVLAVISILLFALSFRMFTGFVPATYQLCCSKRDASVRQPARTRDELDVLQLGDKSSSFPKPIAHQRTPALNCLLCSGYQQVDLIFWVASSEPHGC